MLYIKSKICANNIILKMYMCHCGTRYYISYPYHKCCPDLPSELCWNPTIPSCIILQRYGTVGIWIA